MELESEHSKEIRMIRKQKNIRQVLIKDVAEDFMFDFEIEGDNKDDL
jgi:hypothetical protein